MTCEHEAPPYRRLVPATTLPSPGESAMVPCIHCDAPLQRARDARVLTGWQRTDAGWRACVGLHDVPEVYSRDGLPPDD